VTGWTRKIIKAINLVTDCSVPSGFEKKKNHCITHKRVNQSLLEIITQTKSTSIERFKQSVIELVGRQKSKRQLNSKENQW
jgi:hypothetical protein